MKQCAFPDCSHASVPNSTLCQEHQEKLQETFEAQCKSFCINCLTGHSLYAICPKTGDYQGKNESFELKDALKLWALCRQFIDSNHIGCPETIYQSDRVILMSYKFVEEICKIVGYHKEDTECPSKPVIE